MEFKVKRDFLLIFLINVVLAFLVCVAIPFAYNTWVFVVVFTICLAILILFNTSVIFASCKVENNVLTFKTGVFSYKIDLNSIVKVERTKNLYSSLALSCDKIRILTNSNGKNKVYYISVMDNENLISILSPKEKTVAALQLEEKESITEEKPAPQKAVVKKTATKKTVAKKTTTKTTTKKTGSKKGATTKVATKKSAK